MKKLLRMFCLFIFLFLSDNSFAQTEAETKNWLEEKLGKYLESSPNGDIVITSVTVETCSVSIMFNRWGDPNKLTVPTDCIIEKLGIYTTGKRIIITNLKTNEKSLYSVFYSIELIEGEIDLVSRVKKALDHMATFCPKKKEPF